MTATPIRVAVDIGGTFTDIQIQDLATGRQGDFKSPTTPDDPSRGLIAGLSGAAQRFGFGLDQIGLILHGSTIATNAVLERKLPKGALLTTKGFEDVLEIGRHMRHNVYALKAEPRPLLIPRDRRLGVAERIRSDGSVETPLDSQAVRAAGLRLVDDGVQAVAVMFLHGYRNPVHEAEAAEILSNIPGLAVTTSHEVSPEIREFERASTTVLNALLKPVISGYLDRVQGRLAEGGVSARLYLVQSNGGVATPAEAARLPAKLLLSGPAGGAMALAGLAQRHRIDNLVGLDMGGTSSDVSVVAEGRVGETGEGQIDGLPVRLPMIEIRTIGAGGGSLADVQNGALRVGPESAGSQPGPACYGRGGTRPTVTDANLALGRIDPAGFLGGEMALDMDAASTAIGAVAGPLGLSPESTADGIVQVANASMANAVRLSLFEKGADPADFTLAPFGGAGGLHACAVAEELDIRRILFPATASTLSARGILDSDLRHDLSRSGLMLADAEALPVLVETVAALRTEAGDLLAADGMAPDARRIEIAADMRYRGQAYEITTPWADLDQVDIDALDRLVAAFHDLHQTRYAHSAPGEPVEIVTMRAVALGLLDHPDTPSQTIQATSDAAPRTRQVWVGDCWTELPVHRREALGTKPLTGPLVIEEDYSVHLIGAGWTIRVLGHGDLMAERSGGTP